MSEKHLTLGLICYPGFELEEMKSACEVNSIAYKEIDFFSDNWMQQVGEDIDGYIVRPPCIIQEHKSIFDERIFFLNQVLNKPVYPNLNELLIYENKRLMATFLEAFNYPHAKTKVFFNKESVLKDFNKLRFPLVVKSNIGSSASGVRVVKTASQLKSILRSVFGLLKPRFAFGLLPWSKYKGIKLPNFGASQKHYLIVQEYVEFSCEWRMIRVGNSYFGHQKLKGEDGFASGSLLVGWEAPGRELLELLHNTTESLGMSCMVLDIFQTEDGKYLINEMQAIIGAYRPYQMKVDGVPGRYLRIGNEFVFEPGEHCQNKLWNLRLADFKEKLKG